MPPSDTQSTPGTITVEKLPELLAYDNSVKLAGVDVDGQLRGKLVSKKKFLSVAESGFGFCSVIFGWDMHDLTYVRELKISNKENGYRDIIAVPDLSSFRRIPWENNVPFFLVSFLDPDTLEPVSACPRGLLKTQLEKLQGKGYGAMAGGTWSLRLPLKPRPPSLTAPVTSRIRVLPVSSTVFVLRYPRVGCHVSTRESPKYAPVPYRGHVRLQLNTASPQSRILL
jgi:glutamine synthetase